MSCISESLCSKALKGDLTPDCRNRLFSGMAGGAVIFSKDDVKSVVFDANRKNVVSLITLKDDAVVRRWYMDTKQPYNGTGTAMNANDTMPNDFTHTFSGMILANGSETTEDIEALASGRFVVVAENDYKGNITGNYYGYQIYGLDKGLRASEIATTKYENNDGWTCNLSEENVPNAGRFLLVKEQVTGLSANTEATEDGNGFIANLATTSGTPSAVSGQYSVKGDDFPYTVTAEVVDDEGVKVYGSFDVTYDGTETVSEVRVTSEGVVFVFGATPTGYEDVANADIYADGTCAYLAGLLGIEEETNV